MAFKNCLHITLQLIFVFHQLYFFFKDFILFLERGEGREKERERNVKWLPLTCPQLGTWPATQACALTGKGIGDLSVCKLMLNLPSYTSQGHPFVFIFYFFNLLFKIDFIDLFERGGREKKKMRTIDV